MKTIIKCNGINLNAIPGNLKLVPSSNEFGPFSDRTYSEGSIRSRKNSFVGYYERTTYNGLTVISIQV